MEHPKVSIIVPVYNSEQYLKECIESILAQTFTEFECILVDDKSKDKSFEICNFYASKDKRIIIIRNTKNMGSSLSRKKALDVSRGIYIQYIDSDDWIENDMIEKLYEKAISGNYDMVYCDAYVDNLTGDTVYAKIPVEDDNIINMKRFILGNNRGAGLPYKFVKKSLYDSILFSVEGFAEDKYITTQLLYKAKTIGHMNSAFYHVRSNPHSQMRSHSIKMEIHRYKGLRDNFKKVIDFLRMTYGDNLDEFEPELSIKIKSIKALKTAYIKNIVKEILKILIPFKPVRNKLRKIYNKIKVMHST
jgi:glycosyltransferase involved in cell wall biosynthesis